jgi:hypothetical protein
MPPHRGAIYSHIPATYCDSDTAMATNVTIDWLIELERHQQSRTKSRNAAKKVG